LKQKKQKFKPDRLSLKIYGRIFADATRAVRLLRRSFADRFPSPTLNPFLDFYVKASKAVELHSTFCLTK
jgi:hypothetical protein